MTDITLDTNILFYAFDPADAAKHVLAKNLVAACYRRAALLSLQCLNEFYRAATRKLVTPSEASAIVNDLRKGLSIIVPNEIDSVRAMEIHSQIGFQFFDCLLLATGVRAGCTVLLSEDFQHNRTYSGLTIVNPFQLTAEELGKLLA